MWTVKETEWLKKNYPLKGKMFCCEFLKMKEFQVRYKAAALGLRLEKGTDFLKNRLLKMAKTNTGRKRPAQAEVIKRLWRDGKIKVNIGKRTKKERACTWCKGMFYHVTNRKTCSNDCAKNIQYNCWKVYKHPKGMEGKKHRDSVKDDMSIRSKKMWADPNHKLNSEQHRQSLSDRSSKMRYWARAKNPYSKSKRGWWISSLDSNKRYFLRSSWEVNYANYLDWLKNKGQIKEWLYEEDTFWFEKIKRGVRSYTPDFKVFNNSGDFEYHEVKGWLDNRSKTKIKRMGIYYPSIKFNVIYKKEYKEIMKWSRLFPVGIFNEK